MGKRRGKEGVLVMRGRDFGPALTIVLNTVGKKHEEGGVAGYIVVEEDGVGHMAMVKKVVVGPRQGGPKEGIRKEGLLFLHESHAKVHGGGMDQEGRKRNIKN